MRDLTTEPLLDKPLPVLAAWLTEAFTGYILPMTFTEGLVAHMIRCEAVDLTAGRLARRDGQPAGVALIGRRGSMSRLAAMAIMPEARGRGVGRRLMETVIAEARERGEAAMTLEVIEQNTAAVRLYEGVGFQRLRRLVGYTAESSAGVADPDLEEVDLSEVARAVITYGARDLPWQPAGETLAQMALPTRGYRLGPAYAAISNPESSPIAIRALVVLPEARRQGWAGRLIRALQARFSDKTWKVPIIYPEDLSPGLFETLGFQREAFSQLQMTLSLRGETNR